MQRRRRSVMARALFSKLSIFTFLKQLPCARSCVFVEFCILVFKFHNKICKFIIESPAIAWSITIHNTTLNAWTYALRLFHFYIFSINKLTNMFQNPTSPVAHLSIDRKLNGKRHAYNKKFGSPKLKDMLREVTQLFWRLYKKQCIITFLLEMPITH